MCRRCHSSAFSADSLPVCHSSSWQDVLQCHTGLSVRSHKVDYAKLCEHCNDEKGHIKDEEKDPIASVQVEPAQRNNDKGQNQGQTQ